MTNLKLHRICYRRKHGNKPTYQLGSFKTENSLQIRSHKLVAEILLRKFQILTQNYQIYFLCKSYFRFDSLMHIDYGILMNGVVSHNTASKKIQARPEASPLKQLPACRLHIPLVYDNFRQNRFNSFKFCSIVPFDQIKAKFEFGFNRTYR